MAFLIISPQEQTANVVEHEEDVMRASLTFLPSDLVERWLLTAVVSDVIQDTRFGRIQIIKLGDITDAEVVTNRRRAKELLKEATDATAAAVNVLKGGG